MNSLFEGYPPQFKAGDTKIRVPRKNNTVDYRTADVSGVINEMDLRALVVVESPNRAEELQLFFDRNEIDKDWKCAVQQSDAQIVGLATGQTDIDTIQDSPFTQFDSSLSASAPLLKAATDPFPMDTDKDGLDGMHKYERRPLYTEMKLRVSGIETLMLSVWNPDLTLGNVIYDGLGEGDRTSLAFGDI